MNTEVKKPTEKRRGGADRRSPEKTVMILAVVMFIVFVFTVGRIIGFRAAGPGLKTSQAVYQTVTRYVSADAFVVRDERTFGNPNYGTLVPILPNGSKVSIGDTVAKIYPTDVDAGTATRLAELESNIAYYKSLGNTNSANVYSDITVSTGNVRNTLIAFESVIADNDLEQLKDFSARLREDITKKQIACGVDVDVSQKLAELQTEYDSLVLNLTSNSPVNAPDTGYYTDTADGYESSIDVNNINDITYSDVEDLLASEPPESETGSVGKIIKDFNWYVVCNVSIGDLPDVSENSYVWVSFPKVFDGSLRMFVCKINYSDTPGYQTLILKCNEMNPTIASLRKEKINISAEKKSGLVINPNAIRMIDGTTGVYIQFGNVVKFKKINVIYSDSSVALVEYFADDMTDYLRQFDEVIIEGTDLYDGKKLS